MPKGETLPQHNISLLYRVYVQHNTNWWGTTTFEKPRHLRYPRVHRLLSSSSLPRGRGGDQHALCLHCIPACITPFSAPAADPPSPTCTRQCANRAPRTSSAFTPAYNRLKWNRATRQGPHAPVQEATTAALYPGTTRSRTSNSLSPKSAVGAEQTTPPSGGLALPQAQSVRSIFPRSLLVCAAHHVH